VTKRSSKEKIGTAVPRVDAVDKVRGEARFADDLAFPGMLYGKVIRSDVPHAHIRCIDLSAVSRHPHVVSTVTAEDIPGENVVHVIYDDQPALAAGLVRYVGEPIALVATETRNATTAVEKLAKIDYEKIPPVTDPLEALKPDAPAVAVPGAVEEPPNLFNVMRLRKGDIKRGFAQAEVIVEGRYRTGYQEHAYLETQGMIAMPEENGAFAIYGSMQCPFYVQAAVARVLGLPLTKVRVMQTATGGAFGGKEDVPSQIACLAALLAWKSRQAVKLVLSRKEDILTTSKRHPSIVHYRSGAKADGTLTAVEVDFIYDAGAYQTLSSAVLWRGLITAAGPYRVPNVKIDGRSVATNTIPCGAFRGFGSPQVIFPHESQMDLLAERLGIDRLEIRRRNALREGDETATGQHLVESVGVYETIEQARSIAKWSTRLRSIEQFNRQARNLRRGLGISTVMYGVGLGGKAPFLDKAGAYMKLEADGSVSLAVGTVEMGQGLSTALLQIASEALNIPVERLHFAPIDTSRVPDSGPTVASRGTIMSGLAILDAARKLNDRIRRVAQELGISPERTSDRLEEIAQAFWHRNLDPATEGWAHAEPVDWDPETGLGNPYAVYAYATHIAEVEVSTTTGEISVKGWVAVHDSGRILNRQTAAGQVEGGIAQGIGLAVMEEIPQKDGRLTVNGLTTYRIPTVRDAASQIDIAFVEASYSAGPFGAKGIGEVPLMAAHAAVSRAIAHAISKPIDTYPLTPQRIKETLESQR
jgi:CO/xanthine dehydrogenase Mo-binding subunit